MMKSLVIIIALSLAIPSTIQGQGSASAQFSTSAEVIETVSCGGYSDGAIAIDLEGGQAPYHISLTHVSTSVIHKYIQPSSGTFHLDQLYAGEYFLLVTDAGGNSSSQRLLVEEPLPLILETFVTHDASYHGLSNGAATVTVQGGAGGYSYLWHTKPNHTSASVSGLSSGMYVVEVMDRNGCRSAEAVTIVNQEIPDAKTGAFITGEMDLESLRSRTQVRYVNHDAISVRLPELTEPGTLYLMDLAGRRVMRQAHTPNQPEITFDMQSLPQGVYTLFMQQANRSIAIQSVQRR